MGLSPCKCVLWEGDDCVGGVGVLACPDCDVAFSEEVLFEVESAGADLPSGWHVRGLR